MTTLAPSRASIESFIECIHSGADKDVLFRLQIEDTVVNGMDYILLNEDGKIAEVTVFWRPLPSAVEMQGHLAQILGMRSWEPRTDGK